MIFFQNIHFHIHLDIELDIELDIKIEGTGRLALCRDMKSQSLKWLVKLKKENLKSYNSKKRSLFYDTIFKAICLPGLSALALRMTLAFP